MPEAIARPVIGFIGLGDQGLPMATAIAESGFDLHTWARRPRSTETPGEAPQIADPTPRALASACDIVEVCVSTDKDVITLLEDGLLDGLRPGTVFVNHGTGTPKNAREIARLCGLRGVGALDAPVSGGRPAGVRRGVRPRVGGPPAPAERCRAVFDSFSTHVVHLGDTGAGQTTKILNNTLRMMNQASIYEITQLAEKLEVDPIRLIDALKLGSGASRAMELLGTMINPETVDHLTKLVDIDMDVFDNAMQDANINAAKVSARARTGVKNLNALAHRLSN